MSGPLPFGLAHKLSPVPLPKGAQVPPFGEIVDVWEWPMQIDGKVGRTYVLRGEHGVKYLPASVVERQKEVTK